MAPLNPPSGGGAKGISRSNGSDLPAERSDEPQDATASDTSGRSVYVPDESSRPNATAQTARTTATRMSIFSRGSAATAPAGGEVASLPEGIRGLLAGRIPSSTDFAERFQAAVNYGLDRFMRLGEVRERPPKMGEHIWLTLTDTAESESELAALLREHPRKKEAGSSEQWEDEVERAAANHKLRTLASTYTPANITNADWEKYVRINLGAHHPENVVAEPITKQQREAIVPAYRFLRSEGVELDPVEYLSAIYPLFGELANARRADNDDGSIPIPGPLSVLFDDLFGDLSLDDFSYQRLAQRIGDRGFPTLVLTDTLGDQARRRERIATYESVARHAEALAASVHASPDEERGTYLFIASLPRVIGALAEITNLFAPNSSRINGATTPADDAPKVKLADDGVQYPTDFRAPSSNRWLALRVDVRRGMYRSRLELTRGFLRLVEFVDSSMGAGITLTPPGQGLESQIGHTRDLASRIDGVDARLAGDEIPEGSKDRTEVERFYSDVREMADRVFFFTRATGSIASAAGALPFIATARIEGRRPSSDGAAILFLNDIAKIANEEPGWDEGRVQNLIHMRVYAWHAMERGLLGAQDAGDPIAVERVTREFLTDETAGWDQAARDFVRLESEGLHIPLRDPVGEVRKKHDGSTARALEEMRASSGSSDASRGSAENAQLEPRIAERALMSYAALFPEARDSKSRIPADDRLLKLFVEIESEAYPKANRRLALAAAADLLARYNSDRRAPAIAALAPNDPILPVSGLFEPRFIVALHEWRRANGNERIAFNEAAVRNGWFVLRERIAAGDAINDDDISSAIKTASENARANGAGSRTNGVETKLLARLVRRQQADIARWREIVSDTKLGAWRFVRDGFNAPYVTQQGIEAFAIGYAAHRLTSARDVDTDAIAAQAVGDTFAPYPEIADMMAGNYRALFSRWLQHLGTTLSVDVQNARTAIDIAAAQTDRLPQTAEELKAFAADIMGAEKFAELESSQTDLALLREFVPNLAPQGEPLADAAAKAFDEKIAPLIEQRRASDAESAARLKEAIKYIANRAATVAEQSSALLHEWSAVTDISGMDERATADFISRATAGLNILTGLDTELGAVVGLHAEATRADEKAPQNHESLDSIQSNIDAARTNIDNATERLFAAHDAGVARHAELERARVQERNAARARDAMAAANNVSSALEKNAAAAEDIGAKDSATIESEFNQVSAALRGGNLDYAAFLTRAHAVEEVIASAQSISEKAAEIRKNIAASIDRPSADAKESALAAIASQLEKAAASVDEEQRKQCDDVMARLSEAKHAGAVAREKIDNIIRRMQEIEKNTAVSLAAAERSIQFGPATGMPAASEARPKGVDDFRYAFVNSAAERKSHVEAQKALDSVLTARAVTIQGKSLLLPGIEAKGLETWFKAGRTQPIILTDVFDNQIKLTQDTIGIRLAATDAELPETHPFAKLIRTLRDAVSEPGNEAALLSAIGMSRQARYPGSPQKLLLQDLYATMARADIAGGSADARALVRRWAMEHRAELARETGGASERFFVKGRGIAEANKPIRSPEYTLREHTEKAGGYAESLERPNRGATPDIINFMRLMHRICSDEALMDLGYAISHTHADSPFHNFLRSSVMTAVRSAMNPLMRQPDLALLQDETRAAFHEFMRRTMQGPGESEYAAPFAPADVELAMKFRETGMAGGSQLWSVMRHLEDGTIASSRVLVRLMEIFPTFSGAIALMAVVHERLGPQLMDELGRLVQECDARAGTGSKTDNECSPRQAAGYHRQHLRSPSPFPLPSRERVAETPQQAAGNHLIESHREKFIEIYGRHAQAIRDALVKRGADGMSLAQWMTGTEDFSDGQNDWKSYPPHTRLVTIAPEFAAMSDRNAEATLAKFSEAADGMKSELGPERHHVRWMLEFAKARPEFAKTIALLALVLENLPTGIRYGVIYNFFTGENGPWNNSALAAAMIESDAPRLDPAEAFVDIVTNPLILKVLRDAMQQPLPGMSSPTTAEIFLGGSKPWLYQHAESALLPPSDLADIYSMEEGQLAARIDARAGELGVLQQAARRRSSSKAKRLQRGDPLQHMIGMWQALHEENAREGRGAVLIVDRQCKDPHLRKLIGRCENNTLVLSGNEASSTAFAKMILVLEHVDKGLVNIFKQRALASGVVDASDLLRLAYGFMVERRAEIISAAKGSQAGGGSSGGGGSSVPPPPSAPPMPPTPAAGGASPVAAMPMGALQLNIDAGDTAVISGLSAAGEETPVDDDEASAVEAMESSAELMTSPFAAGMPAALPVL